MLSLRLAEANHHHLIKKRAFIWVTSGAYPYAEDFFPSGSENNWSLSKILQPFGSLKQDMVVVQGVDLASSGINPKGNNHVRTQGLVLTAKNVIQHPTNNLNGLPGGPSIDHIIAQSLGLKTLETQVHHKNYDHLRSYPFATGPKSPKKPIINPAEAWDKVFKGFQPSNMQTPAAQPERIKNLQAQKSVLDGMIADLGRFKKELVGDEKLKLDIHEDSIRVAEKSIADDLKAQTDTSGGTELSCPAISRGSLSTSTNIPTRAKAFFDLHFAALLCQRVGISGMVWGHSGYHWRYDDWIQLTKPIKNSVHDEVHHYRTSRREDNIRAARWDWEQLSKFAKRLKDTPEGESHALNNIVVYATSHFGLHHQLKSVPIVFMGNAQGALRTNRFIKLNSYTENDKPLTSLAHLMGATGVKGIGNNLNSGPLSKLHE